MSSIIPYIQEETEGSFSIGTSSSPISFQNFHTLHSQLTQEPPCKALAQTLLVRVLSRSKNSEDNGGGEESKVVESSVEEGEEELLLAGISNTFDPTFPLSQSLTQRAALSSSSSFQKLSKNPSSSMSSLINLLGCQGELDRVLEMEDDVFVNLSIPREHVLSQARLDALSSILSTTTNEQEISYTQVKNHSRLC